MNSLPNEILLRIFSRIEKYELLNIEKTCQRWRTLIQENVWNRLTCIDERIIGYPDREDFLANFIAIAHRVREAKEFFPLVETLYSTLVSAEATERVKKAMLELISKHTSDCVFYLDMIETVLLDQYDYRITDPQPPVSEARNVVNQLLHQLRVGEFEAVKMDEFPVHDPDGGSDSFTVCYKGREMPLPLDGSRVTTVYIDCLVAWMAELDRGAVLAARNQINRMTTFARLEMIEIGSVELLLPSPTEEDESPVLSITLFFEPHSCRFNFDDFIAFLTTLTKKIEITKSVLKQIDEWRSKDMIQSAEISIHSAEMDRLESIVRIGLDLDENVSLRHDPIVMILSRVFPSLTNKLHLSACNNYDGEEKFIALLQRKKMFCNLKEFSITFTDEPGEEVEEISVWDAHSGARRARKLLRALNKGMDTLESLTLSFGIGGNFCPKSMFDPVAIVSKPLPLLQKIYYFGIPCFPFIISAVRHAPHLRELTVGSQPFEDEKVGLEWVKKLLDAIEGHQTLRRLLVYVNGEDRLNWLTRERRRVPRDAAGIQFVLDEIKRQVTRIVSSSPQLGRMTIELNSCNYEFQWDRERRKSASDAH